MRASTGGRARARPVAAPGRRVLCRAGGRCPATPGLRVLRRATPRGGVCPATPSGGFLHPAAVRRRRGDRPVRRGLGRPARGGAVQPVRRGAVRPAAPGGPVVRPAAVRRCGDALRALRRGVLGAAATGGRLLGGTARGRLRRAPTGRKFPAAPGGGHDVACSGPAYTRLSDSLLAQTRLTDTRLSDSLLAQTRLAGLVPVGRLVRNPATRRDRVHAARARAPLRPGVAVPHRAHGAGTDHRGPGQAVIPDTAWPETRGAAVSPWSPASP
jgi:hypothetical protein